MKLSKDIFQFLSVNEYKTINNNGIPLQILNKNHNHKALTKLWKTNLISAKLTKYLNASVKPKRKQPLKRKH